VRVKVEYRTSNKSVYEKFCSTHPEIKLSFTEWKKILQAFSYAYRDYILETGDKVKLPFGLGSFTINKRKTQKTKIYMGKQYINLPVDWAETKKAGKYIYHLNTATDGCKYNWMWLREDARWAYSIWNFKPLRETSRLLKDYLKKPNSFFFQIYKTWTRK
jgi:nucleoid DNA-binding protein